MKRSMVGYAITVALFGLIGNAAVASAAQPKWSLARASGKVTLTATANDLVVRQALTPETFDLTITRGKDAVEIKGTQTGEVSVHRNGRTYRLKMRAATAANFATVRGMLAGSSALATLAELSESSVKTGRRDALLLANVTGLVGTVQGRPDDALQLVERVREQERTGVLAVAQQSARDCWDWYVRDVVQYTYDLEACLRAASYRWWDPLGAMWCSYEYNLKSNLAAYWLLNCNGLPW